MHCIFYLLLVCAIVGCFALPKDDVRLVVKLRHFDARRLFPGEWAKHAEFLSHSHDGISLWKLPSWVNDQHIACLIADLQKNPLVEWAVQDTTSCLVN
jgi:hypothetical protein